MITTAKPRIGTPIVPRNKADPTQSYRQVNKMYRDIEERYLGIKTALKQIFDERLTGRVREGNAQAGHAMHDNTIYQVNAGAFIYDMSAQQLADLLQVIQTILDDYLLAGNGQDLWALQYVAAEFERGTLNAYTNLSVQSPVYASQTTLSALLSSPAYQNQVAAAFVSTYSEWKGISDAARSDLANIVADAIGRGVNPRETMKVISKRLDVSMSKAKTIAQTEQVGALREAQWNETTWTQDRLGLRTKLLHLSALKPTTRSWHASRHGKLYTVEEVREWYSKDGNRFNCYCSQVPAIVDEQDKLVNEGLVAKLVKERNSWEKG
ncbi:phage head morphogenesis protein [Serratia grimesii]|uniref:phage head morphogenesis protein n=1 Tax=Serratia grimesii TaxID=82995 RepID=UPI002177B424|nr:phage head morphogenesis protein [Serratia grimesii]CAI0896168.1 phage head morphogenesis protein, SPP1 gp7 family [Serratia grimesii]